LSQRFVATVKACIGDATSGLAEDRIAQVQRWIAAFRDPEGLASAVGDQPV